MNTQDKNKRNDGKHVRNMTEAEADAAERALLAKEYDDARKRRDSEALKREMADTAN